MTTAAKPAPVRKPIHDEHEPGCDGTGRYHGPHDCRYSGEPEAGCFAVCEECV